MIEKSNPSWRSSFLAVVRYEILWNIRKKKFLGVLILAFGLASISLLLPVALRNLSKQPTVANPNYVITNGTGIGSFGIFLFAIVTVMNSIAGEFESGAIVPLLTKPVSRTTVYLGKISAALLTLLGAYVLLMLYLAIGGRIIYGPQNDLHLLVISLVGSILSTLVWMSIILTLGSVSKSSLIAALLGLGIWFGLNIASGILSVFSSQAWIATYFPGNGASGTTSSVFLNTTGPVVNVNTISTGTDSIAGNSVNYILNPNANVTFFRIQFVGQPITMYTEPLSLIVSRSIEVALVYILVFNVIAWYALKRAQVVE
jgi:ABC-type transport system involved in multi-copper enzyme maturation permease subunit